MNISSHFIIITKLAFLETIWPFFTGQPEWHVPWQKTELFFPLSLSSGKRDNAAEPSKPSCKVPTTRQSTFVAHMHRLTVCFPIFFRRWEYPMTCITSFTICGLKTSLLVSFLDKHTPLTSGQVALNPILNLQPTTRKTTLTQQTNCHVVDIKIASLHFLGAF